MMLGLTVTSKTILTQQKLSESEIRVTGERGDTHLAGRCKMVLGMLLAERRKSQHMRSVVTITGCTATDDTKISVMKNTRNAYDE